MESFFYGDEQEGWGGYPQGWVNQEASDPDPSGSTPYNPNPQGRTGIPKCMNCRRLKIRVFL